MNNIEFTLLILEVSTKQDVLDVLSNRCTCGHPKSLNPNDHDNKCSSRKYLKVPKIKTICDRDEDDRIRYAKFNIGRS